MTAPEIKEGIAVLYPGTGPAEGRDRAHVQVIVTNPDKNGTILLVSICSFHSLADQTCVIEPDDTWGAIIRKSYAAYYCMAGVDISNLMRRIAQHEVTYLGPVPLNIYNKIKEGVAISRETPDMFKKAFLSQQSEFKLPVRILRSSPSS
jgi:hypothetical protein